MYPYQLSKVLADQHIQAMVTRAERRRHGTEARIGSVDQQPAPGQLSEAFAGILGRLRLRSPRDVSTRSSAAGPMGCAT